MTTTAPLVVMRLLFATLAFVVATTTVAQDRLIVMVRTGASPQSIAAKYKVELLDTVAGAPFALYRVPTGIDTHAVQDRMNADPGSIVWAEDDHAIAVPENQASKGATIAAIGERNALYQQNTSVLRQIRFDPAVAARATREVRVAVLDNGMSERRPELWAKTVASANFVEEGSPAHDKPMNVDSNRNGIADEAVGHGSMVVGIVDQVAPSAKLVLVKVVDSDGIGTSWQLIKGLAFAVANRAEVANISLGSREKVPAINDVLEWCEDRGMVTVAAIGNNGARIALSPAESGKAIAVSGIDANDRKASFSNWDRAAVVAAPATGIKSVWWDGQMAVWSGTSFAAPFVSGTIAAGLQQRAPLKADALRDLVEEAAGDDIDRLNPGLSRQLGLRLNYTKLVNAIRNGVASGEDDEDERGDAGKRRKGRDRDRDKGKGKGRGKGGGS